MSEIVLRLAKEHDKELLFNWANDDSVRENSINKEKIKWENHSAWFDAKISSDETYIFILDFQDKPVGQIRFDKTNDDYEIDYSIDVSFRGKGFGQKLLLHSLQYVYRDLGNDTTIKATVLNTNIGSQKVFEKVGFQLDYKDNDRIHYVLKWPLKTYIVLSSKAWNTSTVESLNKACPAYRWIAISERQEFNLDNLIKINPDKIFTPHWSYIIPESIFSKFVCIVFHMTDLPYGRGGSPLQNLIERGHTKTKISAIKVVEELDAGPIYHKEELILSGTAEEIFIRANTIITRIMVKIVLNNLSSKPQTGAPTIFKRRTPKMSSIEDLQDLEAIFNHIRMLDAEGYPHAFIETESFRFEFTRAALKADKSIIADVRIIKK